MSEPSVMLAIEASQRHGGVAVRDPQGRHHVERLRSSARHDDDLLAAVDRLYDRHGLRPAQTGAVAVSVGPGGFTGLRIAVSTAKMLGEALGAKIVAVPTALVATESHDGPGPIIIALAARDDTAWATRLTRDETDGTWIIAGEAGLVDADTIWLKGIKAVLGDDYLPGPIRERCQAQKVPVIEPVFSPSACLDVGWRLLQDGRTSDPLLLAPIYARPPAAVPRQPRR